MASNSLYQYHSDGSVVINDKNLIHELLRQMKYLSNTLHHLSYMIQCIVIRMNSNKDMYNQSTESTYRDVSNALNCLHYFYDLLSFLEWELQYLRNNTTGMYHKKIIPASEKQHENYVFRYDVKLNADKIYKSQKYLKKVTENQTILKNKFYECYDDIESKFQEAKTEFNNYLNFIKCYNLHYTLMCVSSKYGLYDNNRKFYPNETIKKIYCQPFIYLRNFIRQFRTNLDSYDKTKYVLARKTSKRTDKNIIELVNTVIDQQLPANVITYKSLKQDSNDFLNFLATSANTFNISSFTIEEVN
jgi:hypothetical protein